MVQLKDDEEEKSVEESGKKIGKNNVTIPVIIYLEVLDELEKGNAANPYGWMVRIIAVYVVGTLAPLCVYGGGYLNLAAASIISIPVTAEVFIFKYFFPDSCGAWEIPLVR